MSSTGSTQVRDLQLLPPATSLIASVCIPEALLRQNGILRWLLATPKCCHRPPSALATTPTHCPGSSSSSADGVMCKPELETANGTKKREKLQWEDKGGNWEQ